MNRYYYLSNYSSIVIYPAKGDGDIKNTRQGLMLTEYFHLINFTGLEPIRGGLAYSKPPTRQSSGFAGPYVYHFFRQKLLRGHLEGFYPIFDYFLRCPLRKDVLSLLSLRNDLVVVAASILRTEVSAAYSRHNKSITG
jgi:hypothetical protein